VPRRVVPVVVSAVLESDRSDVELLWRDVVERVEAYLAGANTSRLAQCGSYSLSSPV
jgi:hypothetical protein